MAKRPRNTRRTARHEPANDDIFAHFSKHHPGLVTPEYQERPNDGRHATRTADPSTEIQALKDQIARLEASQRTPIPRRAAPVQQTVAAKDVNVSLDGLPDPVSDPTAYQRELQTRMNAALAATRQSVLEEQSAASQQAQQAATLWNQFSEQYPDWAADQEKVKFAATAVIEAAASKGLDTEAYITTHADQFFKDVAGKLEATFGALEPADADEDDLDGDDMGDEGFDEGDEVDDSPPRNPRRRNPDDDDGRTAGIFGGMESGGAPARGKTEPKGDMITDLMAVQKRSGFF